MTTTESPRSSISFAADVLLKIEKLRVAAQVRHSHLRRNGSEDQTTLDVMQELDGVEERITKILADHVKVHPAYPWFSRVKGIGLENIGKVVGLIDIERAPTVSSLWKFAGYAVDDGIAPKRQAGVKLAYNSTLRTMCYRLGTSLMKAGLRHRATGSESPTELERATPEESTREMERTEASEVYAISKFGQLYLDAKADEERKALLKGMTILPAHKGGEREGELFEGHIHNRAMRRMIKAFLACLWESWRKGVDLPTPEPYALAQMGHVHKYGPEDFVDR